jgi:biotin operon repressor
VPAAAAAAPDLSLPREIGGQRVYPDAAKPGLYYLAPGDLEIAIDENGRPKLHFLQMRYTGTALYGNQGEAGVLSTLTIGVRLDVPTEPEMRALRKAVQTFAGRQVELRPLPITSLDAVLAYAPIGGESSDLETVGDGYFESEDQGSARSDNRSFWRERTFTIAMNAATSQLLWELLHRQEVALSINYAFLTRGVHSGEQVEADIRATDEEVEKKIIERLKDAGVPIADRKGPKGVTAKLLERLREQEKKEKEEAQEWARAGEDEAAKKKNQDEGPPQRTQLARAGAIAIRIDAARWPELFKRIDFNEQAPPGYAVLRLYCYDFKDGLRPELLFKKVDVEATAVGGRTVSLSTKFLRSQPDLYARSLRFELPVLLDRPYRFRVTTARPDGTLDEGPWTLRESWTQILDVTSRPDEVTAAPQPALGENQEGGPE